MLGLSGGQGASTVSLTTVVAVAETVRVVVADLEVVGKAVETTVIVTVGIGAVRVVGTTP